MIPASGEYIMICPITLVNFFFMLITFLIITVYSTACQNGDKKRENQVKMPSRKTLLTALVVCCTPNLIYLVRNFGDDNPFFA